MLHKVPSMGYGDIAITSFKKWLPACIAVAIDNEVIITIDDEAVYALKVRRSELSIP